MTAILALSKLYADVTTRFALEIPSVVHVFGWREPPRQFTGPRIAWVPGDVAGNIGTEEAPRNVGRNPRPLATLRELFHCVISSSDQTNPENEHAQYVAVRLLRDAWFRAVYLAAHGTVRTVSQAWNIDRQNERRFGATIVVVCSIESMIADLPLESVPADTAINARVALLDVTENIHVIKDSPP